MPSKFIPRGKPPLPPINPMPMEPDADEKGGPSDKDKDDKGFLKLRYKGKKRRGK